MSKAKSAQMGVPRLGGRTAGLSDHRHEGLAGQVGKYNHFSGSGRALDLLVAEDGGALDQRCDPDQVGVPGLGDRAAGLSDHGREGLAGQVWGGTTISRVRSGTRSTGPRRRGRTGSRSRSGPSGGPWAGKQALGYPTTDEMATPDGVGRYNHFSGAVGHSIYWSPKTGAHWVAGRDPIQVGVAGLGEKPTGLSDQGRVLGFRRPGIGLSARPPDLELDHQAGHWIAASGANRVRGSRTLLAPGLDCAGLDRPGSCLDLIGLVAGESGEG